LYTTFWSLSLYDLYVPVSRYDEEINKLEQNIKALADNSDMASPLCVVLESFRDLLYMLYSDHKKVDYLLQVSTKKKKEQEKYQIVIDKLKEEKQKQLKNHKMIMVRFTSGQDEWFNTSK